MANQPSPHEVDHQAFFADPLTWLAESRRARGPVFRFDRGGAIFSRLPGSCPVFAVFGEPAVRQVLTDSAAFRMPARTLELPPRQARLSQSLHSMGEPEHGHHKRALGAVFGAVTVDAAAIDLIVEQFAGRSAPGTPQPLLARMRELSQRIAQHHLLGAGSDPSIAASIHEFFTARQQAAFDASRASPASRVTRAALLAKGRRLDRLLRQHLTSGSGADPLGRLCGLPTEDGRRMSLDEAIGHANIAMASAIEPVAVALTWTLLLLSQRADLRQAMRPDNVIVDGVLLESLRVLPPNAFMVRVTSRAVQIGKLLLPPQSEVLLCPFIDHRNAQVFSEPDAFLPERWKQARPSAFEYFPFGAGHHGCIGRSLGMDLLRCTLQSLVRRFDIVLAGDQAIDWRVDILMVPRSEIQALFVPIPSNGAGGGRWAGPVSGLVHVEDGEAAVSLTKGDSRS